MRIMLDTNVLISLVFFPNSRFRNMVRFITEEHQMVIPTYVIDEVTDVALRKFPDKTESLDRFLDGLSYELTYTPLHIPTDLFQIRDPNDYPILYCATHDDIDIFITGDKDFMDLGLERPEIMTPTEFIENFNIDPEPNEETLHSFREADEIIRSGTSRFNTAEEMFAALDAEDD